MLLESTILDGRVVGSGRGLDDNNTNSAQQELGLGLSLAIKTDNTISTQAQVVIEVKLFLARMLAWIDFIHIQATW